MMEHKHMGYVLQRTLVLQYMACPGFHEEGCLVVHKATVCEKFIGHPHFINHAY